MIPASWRATAHDYLLAVGESVSLFIDALRSLRRLPHEGLATTREFEHLIVGSLPLTMIVGGFTGAVLGLQMAYNLERFGAKLYIGDMVSLSLCRELGPVLTGIVAGGRIGAGITATLGTMAVTEQVDAVRALGASVAKKLVLPRLLAVVLGLPLLTAFADAVGMLGGFLISTLQFHISPQFTYNHLFQSLHQRDFFEGMAKAFCFGIMVLMASVHQGLNVRGGAGGVGFAVTRTVALICILVLVADFFLTKFFIIF